MLVGVVQTSTDSRQIRTLHNKTMATGHVTTLGDQIPHRGTGK